MKIPKIIHQTWKEERIPEKWKAYQQKVQRLHPDWQYKLWSDAENDAFVKKEFPEFYPVYKGFSRNIMRADVIRYMIMYKIGGLYLDLDYEMLKPFDFEDAMVVLPKNRSISEGDAYDGIGNCVFASVPRHVYWENVLDDLANNPPEIENYGEVIAATGPLLLTRIYFSKNYPDVLTPERIVFHPAAPKTKQERERLEQNGITYGIHHGWGSWKERLTWTHVKRKIKQWIS